MDDVYQYKFANGAVVSVPLSEEWTAILQELDRMEENNNQMEQRRHCSLEWYNRCDNRLPQPHDAFEEVEERDTWDQMCRYLTRQEALIGDLYFRKSYLQQDIADCLDLSQGRVAQVIQGIRKIFQQIFDSSLYFDLSRELLIEGQLLTSMNFDNFIPAVRERHNETPCETCALKQGGADPGLEAVKTLGKCP